MSSIVLAGGFTMDHTVLPDGTFQKDAPGGNILYSAIGASHFCKDVVLYGSVGSDYPQHYLDQLEQAGICTQYVQRLPLPNIKMWALYETNEQRQLIYRLNSGTNQQMDPYPTRITPQLLARTGAVHICPVKQQVQQDLARAFAGGGRTISLDVIHIPGVLSPAAYADSAMLENVNCFLPSAAEVQVMFPNIPLTQVLKQWCSQMPNKVFVIKDGANGCYVGHGTKQYHVPPYPTKVVDTTGAGDSFCGGFLAGYYQTQNALQAAVMGSVAASFTIQNFGGMHALCQPQQKIQARLQQVRQHAEEL